MWPKKFGPCPDCPPRVARQISLQVVQSLPENVPGVYGLVAVNPSVLSTSAERTGFEPVVGCYPDTGLANRRYRPLSHLSNLLGRFDLQHFPFLSLPAFTPTIPGEVVGPLPPSRPVNTATQRSGVVA